MKCDMDRVTNYGNPGWMFRLMLRCYPYLQKEYTMCKNLGMPEEMAREHVLDVADYMIFEHEWLKSNNYGCLRGIVEPPKKVPSYDNLVQKFESVPIMEDKNIDFSKLGFKIVWMPDLGEFRYVEEG